MLSSSTPADLNYATKRRHIPPQLGENPLEPACVAHIGLEHRHADPCSFEVGDLLALVSTRGSARKKDERPRTLLHQPLAHQQAQAAQTAGDQVAAVCVHRGRCVWPQLGSSESSRVALTGAVGDLRGGPRRAHLGNELCHTGRIVRGVQVAQRAAQIRVLQSNRPSEAPEGRLRRIHPSARGMRGANLLCSTRHQPQPPTVARLQSGSMQRLEHMQDTTATL